MFYTFAKVDNGSKAEAEPDPGPVSLAEARSIPEPFTKLDSTPNVPSNTVNKTRMHRNRKSKRKRCKFDNCSTCSGIYPIPYPGTQAGKRAFV